MDYDNDALDVQDYAKMHPESDDEDDKRERSETGTPDARETKVPCLEFGDQLVTVSDSAADDSGFPSSSGFAGDDAVLDDSVVPEPSPKAARTSPSESPMSSTLFAPHFAGNINSVPGEVDDEVWESAVRSYVEDPLEDSYMEEIQDEGFPPELDPEELEKVDVAAGFEEISGLVSLKWASWLYQKEMKPRMVLFFLQGQCMTGGSGMRNGSDDAGLLPVNFVDKVVAIQARFLLLQVLAEG